MCCDVFGFWNFVFSLWRNSAHWLSLSCAFHLLKMEPSCIAGIREEAGANFVLFIGQKRNMRVQMGFLRL